MSKIGSDIAYAKTLLEKGELVAIPTETVYGLAGNGLNKVAVAKIFEVKNRPSFDPMILHTNDLEKVKPLVKNISTHYSITGSTIYARAIEYSLGED